MTNWQLLVGDATEMLRTLPAQSVQTCVTSPPYWGLRAYLPDDDPAKAHELGAESTPAEYVANMVAVFDEVWRVLRDDGTLWLNLGDSYVSYRDGKAIPDTSRGSSMGTFVPKGQANNRTSASFRNTSIKHKDLVGIPWRVAFALQDAGWYLRSDIIWHKPNPMPESVQDRPTKAHEYLFLLTKSARYYYDAEAIKEPATCEANGSTFTKGKTLDSKASLRNKRSVWTVATRPYSGSHYAVFPPNLIEPCILAGTSARGQCPECGAPWQRVVERTSMEVRTSDKGEQKLLQGLRTSTSGTMTVAPTSKTVGWEPTCTCDVGEPVPQTVLDPFAGSGTTLQVAIKHQRNAIGIDFDKRNTELVNERLAGVQMRLAI